QAAEHDVLANFAKGFGPGGSATPPLVNSVPIQRINFIQTDVPAEQNSLPPLPALPGPVPEITIIHPPPPPPEPPTLTAVTGPIEIDTVTFDTFTATNGSLVAHRSNGGTLAFDLTTGPAGITI